MSRVNLVVAWFGSDLRCGECEIRPGVEIAGKTTVPQAWSVAGIGRGDAYVVSQTDGRPNYGGTPSDESVRQAVAALKARGWHVTLYPFLLMDVPAGNGLPDPRGDLTRPTRPAAHRRDDQPVTPPTRKKLTVPSRAGGAQIDRGVGQKLDCARVATNPLWPPVVRSHRQPGSAVALMSGNEAGRSIRGVRRRLMRRSLSVAALVVLIGCAAGCTGGSSEKDAAAGAPRAGRTETPASTPTLCRSETAAHTERVNVGGIDEQTRKPVLRASLSANGRFVAFSSGASMLVAGDRNGVVDVFVRDLWRRLTTRVSVSSTGKRGQWSELLPVDQRGRALRGVPVARTGSRPRRPEPPGRRLRS